VERDTTLRIAGRGQYPMPDSGTFSTQGRFAVAMVGTLSVEIATVEIGGDIVALGARGAGLVRRGRVRAPVASCAAASSSQARTRHAVSSVEHRWADDLR
jgi:hypothetical protein